MPEEETIWLRPTGSPGITSSSPVERIATRGFRCTDSHGRFIAAGQRHVARGERAARRRTGASPALKSSPALRMWRPMRGASRMVIFVALGLGVFLDDDRVGAHRQRRRR